MSRHPVFFQGSDIYWRIIFYSDDTKTTPVDPAVVNFFLKKPDGSEVIGTVVDESGVGAYSSTNNVDQYGNWEWRWETSNPTVVDQGIIEVVENVLD